MEVDTKFLNSNTETYSACIVMLHGFAILTLHFSNTCSPASADTHKSLLLSASQIMSAHVKKIPFERQLPKPHLTLPCAAGAGAAAAAARSWHPSIINELVLLALVLF